MNTGRRRFRSDMHQHLLDFVAAGRHGVLTTIKRDGRPQLSNISYAYDPARNVVRISVTADRAETRNLVRDPRASLHATSTDFWSWAVAEGEAELGPVPQGPKDPGGRRAGCAVPAAGR